MGKDLRLKLKGLQNEHEHQTHVNEAMRNLIKVIAHELSMLQKSCQLNQPLKLKQGIIALHHQFRNLDLSAPIPTTQNDDDTQTEHSQQHQNSNEEKLGIHEEFQRHRNYLERTVQGLQKKLVKDQAGFKGDSTRIMQENVALIKEINELRKEISIAKKMKNQNSKSSRAQTTGSQKRQIKENEEEILELLELKKELEAIDSQQ